MTPLPCVITKTSARPRPSRSYSVMILGRANEQPHQPQVLQTTHRDHLQDKLRSTRVAAVGISRDQCAATWIGYDSVWCVQAGVDLQVVVGGAGEGLVFTAMILFASHPVHTEAVSENIHFRAGKISQLFSLILLGCLRTSTKLKLLLFVLLLLGDWYRRQSESAVLCLLSPLSPSLPLQCSCT